MVRLGRGDGERLAVAALLVGYLALAIVYNVVNPIFEAPDEIWHYLYVRHLSEGKGLPRDEGRTNGRFSQQEAAQPPLYYATAALLTFWSPREDLTAVAPPNFAGSLGDVSTDGNKNLFLHPPNQAFLWRGEVQTVHLVRLTTTLWGAATILLTYLIGRSLFRSRLTAFAGAAVVAFNPEFLFLSAAVSNDVAVAAMAALATLLAVRASRAKPAVGRSLRLGAVVGGVILTKPLAAGCFGVVALALLQSCRRAGVSKQGWLAHLGLAASGVALVSGWWFVYNDLTYGSPIPLHSFLSRTNLFDEMPSWQEFVADLTGLRFSYWALFGWFSILVPAIYYQYFDALMLLAALGATIFLARWGRRRFGRFSATLGPTSTVSSEVWWSGVLLVLVAVLSVLGALFGYRLIVLAFQGRLLFGAASGIALLLALGWSALGPGRFGPLLALALALTLLGPAAILPWRVLRPAYAPPPIRSTEEVHPSVGGNLHFGDVVQLLGVDVAPPLGSRVRPGDAIEVTLYLSASRPLPENYVLFVKVVDPLREAIAGTDTYPGHGNYPTSFWEPGKVVVDRYRIRLPTDAPAPRVDQIAIGLYQRETGQRLPVARADGTPVGSAASFGPLVIAGPADPERVRQGIPFREGTRDVIALVRASNGSAARPGEVIQGELEYGSIQTVEHDYTIFVHLEDSSGVVAQDDAPPVRGVFPTSFWRPGDLVRHAWRIQLPADVPPGRYHLTTGWYDRPSGQRLTTPSGDALDLGTVLIEGGLEGAR